MQTRLAIVNRLTYCSFLEGVVHDLSNIPKAFLCKKGWVEFIVVQPCTLKEDELAQLLTPWRVETLIFIDSLKPFMDIFSVGELGSFSEKYAEILGITHVQEGEVKRNTRQRQLGILDAHSNHDTKNFSQIRKGATILERKILDNIDLLHILCQMESSNLSTNMEAFRHALLALTEENLAEKEKRKVLYATLLYGQKSEKIQSALCGYKENIYELLAMTFTRPEEMQSGVTAIPCHCHQLVNKNLSMQTTNPHLNRVKRQLSRNCNL